MTTTDDLLRPEESLPRDRGVSTTEVFALVDLLRSRLIEARQDLRRFGGHTPECAIRDARGAWVMCDCGWSAVEERLPCAR